MKQLRNQLPSSISGISNLVTDFVLDLELLSIKLSSFLTLLSKKRNVLCYTRKTMYKNKLMKIKCQTINE